jgi:sugar/nucleoside kinase (ribokinase family)
MFDLISFGDATIDMFLTLHEANVHCNLKSEECELCLSYADKIPVDSVERIDGAGNASNNAVGASRLGLHTAIVSIVGNDGTGEGIMRHWQDAGIATNFATIDHAHGTNYSTVINFKGERTILVYHEPRNYQFPKGLPSATWAYYTSLASGSHVMHVPLLAWVHEHKAKLVFQPGTFQLKMGKEELVPLIAASEITILNKQEAERIVGNGKDIRELLTALRKLGAKTAVITDGPKGSYADDGMQRLSLGIYDVPAVERTGCGDAYSTALLVALSEGLPLAEAMRWGTVNSASVLGFVGPQKGLLTRTQMDEWLAKFADQPKRF